MNRLLLIIVLFSFLKGYSQDFEVSPLEMFFNAEPGEAQTKYIRVKNHNSNDETFILSVSDYQIDSKGDSKYLDQGSLKQSMSDYISIAPSFIDLKPNEEKEIAVTYQQPVDDYGSKWGIIFVRTATEQTAYNSDKNVSTGIIVSGRIAIKVYQTPGTNKNFNATIDNLMENSNDSDTLRTFTAIVNNLSDIITPCRVFLIASNIETAEETYFPEEVMTVYPKSSRKIELYLPDILPKGTYSLAAILDYGSKTNLEGAQMIIKVE